MTSVPGPLIPNVSDEGIRISFPRQGSPSNQDQNGKAIMAAFKYRLSVGKTLMPTISKVTLRTGDTEIRPEFVELPDMFIIEIPMNYAFSDVKSQLMILK
jgi:hypothetical protein